MHTFLITFNAFVFIKISYQFKQRFQFGVGLREGWQQHPFAKCNAAKDSANSLTEGNEK